MPPPGAGKRILVAGIGNAWMKDDAFGGKVAEAARGASCRRRPTVFDFGTGGLDLAYEAMRGYDALVLDRRQPPGRRAGNAVRDGRRARRSRADRRRRGAEPARDGPGDGAALRQGGRRLARQGRGSSPASPPSVEEMGLELSPEVAEAVERAVGLVHRDGRRAAHATRPTRRLMHELSVSSAIVDTVIRHAARPPRQRRAPAGRRAAPGRPASLEFYFGIVSRDTICEGAALELELISALMRCGECGSEWDPAPRAAARGRSGMLLPQFRCPACGAAGAEVLAGDELMVESIEVEDDRALAERPSRRRLNAPHQGQGRRGRARREHDDRATPTATTSTTPGSRSST